MGDKDSRLPRVKKDMENMKNYKKKQYIRKKTNKKNIRGFQLRNQQQADKERVVRTQPLQP